ncbi:MAG: hypothetical protein KY476_25640, partial [Planctomycetes bacterium]|nr:hypothetical protein [Planctomycetota bacterium]
MDASEHSQTAAPARRTLFQRLELDRAVIYALLLRGWQLAAGAVTLVLMTLFFTGPLQGYYYTFASLIALQSFFELGFSVVVVNLCSHEWSRLRLDEDGAIAGDADALSRLVSLGRLLFRWYGVAAVVFAAAVGVGGALFLGRQSAESISWLPPWVALVGLSSLVLWTLPFVAMLEGCNQVAEVNRFRWIQAVAASLAVWGVMVLGGELWAAAAAALAR